MQRFRGSEAYNSKCIVSDLKNIRGWFILSTTKKGSRRCGMQLVGLETINPGECAVFAGVVEATDLTDADLM